MFSLNQLGTSIVPGKLRIVPQTQLQKPNIVLNTKRIQASPVHVLGGTAVPTTASQTEQRTIYIQSLKTYPKSPKLLKSNQTNTIVLPKISIHRDKLIKLEPLIEETIISENNALSPNLLICEDRSNSIGTDTVHTFDSEPVKVEIKSKTPKITINRNKLVKIGSLTEQLGYEQIINTNDLVVKNDVANDNNITSVATQPHEVKTKPLDMPMISDFKFEESVEIPTQCIQPIKLNKNTPEEKSTTNQVEPPQCSDNNEAVATLEQEPTELYGFYYDNIIMNHDCKVKTIEDTENLQDSTINEDVNEGDGVVQDTVDELMIGQSVDISESKEIETDEATTPVEKTDVDSELKRLTVVSADATFTLMIRAVPDDEKKALIERLRAQNIEIPKYFTKDYKQEDGNTWCHFCDKSFFSPRYLEMHMARHEANGSWVTEFSVPCKDEKCPRMFTNETRAKMHYTYFHDPNSKQVKQKDKPMRERNVPCWFEGCPRIFTSETKAKMHHAYVHGPDAKKVLYKNNAPKELTVPCWFDGCTRMFSTEKFADRHYKFMHQGLKLRVNTRNRECKQCGAIGCTKHLRIHPDERVFQCGFCTKQFKRKAALERHIRVHTGVKPYSCSYCNKSFSQSNSMKLHVMTVHMKLPAPYKKKKSQIQPDKSGVYTEEVSLCN